MRNSTNIDWKNIAKNTEMQGLDQQKIIINDLLMDCITIMRRNGDHDVIFNKLLGLVASFYGADRSYVFRAVHRLA